MPDTRHMFHCRASFVLEKHPSLLLNCVTYMPLNCSWNGIDKEILHLEKMWDALVIIDCALNYHFSAKSFSFPITDDLYILKHFRHGFYYVLALELDP